MNDFFTSFFWFAQPSAALRTFDTVFGWASLVLVVLGIAGFIGKRLISNPVDKKLTSRYANFSFTIGLLGLAWFAVRYDNTPLLGQRFWAGAIILGALVWKGVLTKYLITGFGTEKKDQAARMVKEKYLPKKK